MKLIIPLLLLELKRFFRKRNILVFAVLWSLLLLLVQVGVTNYQSSLNSKLTIMEIEKTKVKNYIHYTQYAAYGVRVMLIPTPMSVLFDNSRVFDQLSATIDSSERLNIYNGLKGKNLFPEPGGFMDFSGLLLLFGSLMALMYGMDIFNRRDYLRYLVDEHGFRKTFSAVILVRSLLLNLLLPAAAAAALLPVWLNGLSLPAGGFFGVISAPAPVIIFFLLCGALTGLSPHTSTRITLTAAIFFTAIFLFPWMVNKIARINAAGLSVINHIEIKKLKEITLFEKKFYDSVGAYRSGEKSGDAPPDVQQLIRSYIDNEYKKIVDLESLEKEKIIDKISQYRIIAVLFPTTFYFANAYELGGRGFQAFIDFYNYSRALKDRFFRFYISRKYFQPTNDIESFIKQDENVFYSRSYYAYHFLTGLLLLLAYITGLFLLNLKLHAAAFKHPAAREPQIEYPKSNNALFVLCRDDEMKDELFRYYQNHPHAVCIRKIRTRDFRMKGIGPDTLMKHLCSISDVDLNRARVHLELTRIPQHQPQNSVDHHTALKIYASVKTAASCRFVVFDNFLKGETRAFETDIFRLIQQLETDGKRVLFLGTEMYYPSESLEERISLENFGVFPIYPDKVTLR